MTVHFSEYLNPLDSKGNYSATSNNTKLVPVHWSLMGGLLHLIQRGYGPLNDSPLLCGFNVAIKGLTRFDYFVQPQTTACVTERFMPTQAIRGRGAVMPVPLS